MDNAFAEYQNLVDRTVAKQADKNTSLAVLTLGLTGESGEVADIVKKVVGHGHELDEDTVTKIFVELGDTLWYIAALASELGLPLVAIAEYNIQKLRTRYPDGFSTEASIARVDARPKVRP